MELSQRKACRKPAETAAKIEPVLETEQGEPDPFGASPLYAPQPIDAERAARRTISVLVRFETFDVPTVSVLEMLDEWKIQEGADILRKQVLQLVKKEEATIHDLRAATVEAGSKATLEAIQEFIYPTEYVPPSSIQELKEMQEVPPTQIGKLFKTINDNIFPTAFETRNTGQTLEIEIGLVTAEENMWDVRLAPEMVEFVGMESYGPEGLEAEMPTFNSTRTSSSVRVKDAVWTLTAIQTPHVGKERNDRIKRLQFVKVERAR